MTAMPEETQASSLKLNADILLEVFSKLDNGGSLAMIDYTSLCSVSRVCAAWRRLALGCPSLWGRALDLTRLGNTSNKWKKEVMRRTQRALLSVHVFFESEDDFRPGITSLLRSILSKEWSRIEYLNISSLPPLDMVASLAELRQLFQRPAPNMKSFDFTVDMDDVISPSFFPTPYPRVFPLDVSPADYPLLRDYSSNQFYLPASGGAQYQHLTHLTLWSSCSAIQLLKLLDTLPSLTALQISDSHAPTTAAVQPLPYVTLQRIRKITFMSERSFHPYIDVLDHLQTPQLCQVYLSCEIEKERRVMNSSNVETLRRVFRRFLNESTHTLKIHTNGMFVVESIADEGRQQFSLFVMGSNNLSRTCIAWCWSLIPSSDIFVGVRQLNLADQPFLLSADDPGTRFCRSMVLVDHLKIRPHMLKTLSTTNLSSIFPALRTLELDCIKRYALEKNHLAQIIGNWNPNSTTMKTLWLPPMPSGSYERNLSFLDDVAVGLRVTWDDKEYICGTGNPRILDFS